MSGRHSKTYPLSVYFIRSGLSGPIKIGYTVKRVKDRLNGLQCGNPVKLHLLGYIKYPDHGFRERELHERFKDIWLVGEWFRATDELLAFIEEHCTHANALKANRKRPPGIQIVDHILPPSEPSP